MIGSVFRQCMLRARPAMAVSKAAPALAIPGSSTAMSSFRRFFSDDEASHEPYVEGCCANDAAEYIRSKLPEGWTPRIGLTLGSGLGDVTDAMEVEVTLSYADIPDFPVSTVEGHAGQLVLGKLNGLNVACFQGRVHLYEGIDPRDLRVPIYSLKLLGCEQYVATTAVGSLMAAGVVPGDLVAISDHINFQARSPLIGENDPIGPRFVDMSNAYDEDLRRLLKNIAKDNDIRLFEGIYAANIGPTFETPAEINMLKAVGADVVGMSTVSEIILARHAGLKCAGLAVVVNFAAGLVEGGITHDETLFYTQNASNKMKTLLSEYCGHTLKELV